MAQHTKVILVDDVDGGDATQTVNFALDGVSYEIDLNDKNAASLRDNFASWVGAARRVGGRRQSGRRGASTTSGGTARKQELAKVRAWGRQNGWSVSERGRISADLQEAYDKAHR